MSDNNASKWGFWIPVKDADSAKYAAKMSGLPVFLLGFSFLVSAFAVLKILGLVFASINILIGGFLFYAGLRIRSGKFGTLPIAVSIWLIHTIWAISVLGFHAASLVSILIGLLAVSGLRGWNWLRKNDREK